MSESLGVAVVFGGPSPEAEVSRVSALAVERALSARGYRAALLELGPTLPRELLEFRPDVVFPVAHGQLGEDGALQGLLEVLGLRYVGSDVCASAVAMDKPTAKVLFAAAGLPVAKELTLPAFDATRGESLSDVARRVSAQAFEALGPGGWVLKPARGGSAIFVERVLAERSEAERAQVIEESLRAGTVLLIEQMAPGLEVTCAVLDEDAGPRALPPTLIVPEAAEWYDFRSKYQAGGSRHQCPAPFVPKLTERIQRAAVTAHRVTGARDLSRTDFIVSEDGEDAPFIVLEINTLPGMTPTSLYPEAAQAAGIQFSDLCERLVQRALGRSPQQQGPAWQMP